MLEKYVCQTTGKEFNSSRECVLHESSQNDYEGEFNSNLIKAIQELDAKYNVTSEIEYVEFRVFDDHYSYTGDDYKYEFRFKISIEKLNKSIEKEIEGSYMFEFNIESKEQLKEILEYEFYVPKLTNRYEGLLYHQEDGTGFGGSYKVGDAHMHTIHEAFKGKKVRIEIIE